METYDDRPISVYDNLNMPTALHTSTPKVKAQTIASATASDTVDQRHSPTAAHNETNGAAARSPYADISFKFNDSMKPQEHQHQPTLPNGKHGGTARAGGQQQVNPSYATSYKTRETATGAPLQTSPTATAAAVGAAMPTATAISAITAIATTTTPIRRPTTTTTTTSTSTSTSPAASAPATAQAITATAVSAAQRPLSQHSQTELNEASQSIAAVKAALNDAKSKFFGLNGYGQDSSRADPVAEPTYKLLSGTDAPRVQILTGVAPPPPKPKAPQPKYQNIPENSAIFRQQPPELPPKPVQYSAQRPVVVVTSTPNMEVAPSTTPSPQPPSPPVSQAKIQPYSTYQHIPLNDIDSSQPSQAVYMTTTVPQNIKGTKIAGRHTPTRNSLRHSRMLVVNNKSYQGVEYPNPMNFKQPNLARWLLILHIVVGLLITFLSTWIFFLAPNAAVQDNPYWSGLVLLLAGVFGLVLVRYQRIKRHKVRENCFLFLRADSYVLSLTAILLCCIAIVCAALHFARLTAADTRCASTNMLLEHGSCSCTFNMATMASNGTLVDAASDTSADAGMKSEDRSYTVEYRDMSCKELSSEWRSILGLSIVLNSIGLVLAACYVLLLACCRHGSKRFYTSVHTSTF